MKQLILYTYLLFLSACSTQIPTQVDSAPSAPPKNLSNIPDAVPKYEPKSRGGNPVSNQTVLATKSKALPLGMAQSSMVEKHPMERRTTCMR